MAENTTAILEISDDVETCDLLGPILVLDTWTPRLAGLKDGGYFSESKLADGAQLAMAFRIDILDEFSLKGGVCSVNEYIAETHKLRRLLNKARAYFLDQWQTEPVWIKAKIPNEQYARWAVIKNYSYPSEPDVYDIEWGEDSPLYENLVIQITHSAWMGGKPGVGTCVAVSSGLGNTTASNESPFTPTANSDDAYVNRGTSTIAVAANDIVVGKNGANDYEIGIRFPNVNLRMDAIVTSVTMQLQSTRNKTYSPPPDPNMNINIKMEANLNPAAFSTYADFIARPRTATTRTWNNGSIDTTTVGSYHLTPTFNNPFDEVRALPGWTPGNAMVVFLRPNSNNGTAHVRWFAAYDDPTYAPAKLAVKYVLPVGQEATCDPDNYAVNCFRTANITHIYTYKAAGAVWSSNLQFSALPYNLLPSPPAVGDIVYFGIDTSVAAQSGPFSNLIASYSPGSGYSGVWEFFQGAPTSGWVDFMAVGNPGIADNTTGFRAQPTDTPVVGSVSWEQVRNATFGDFTTTTVNGITGYWVRYRITAVPGASTAPQQMARNLYTVTWPEVLIDSTIVRGELPALGKMNINQVTSAYQASGIPSSQLNPTTETHRLIVSAYDNDNRSADFVPFLNFAAEQNGPGVLSAAAALGALGAAADTPTGRQWSYTPAALVGTPTEAFVWEVYLPVYRGTFQAFARMRAVNSGLFDNFKVQMRAEIYGALYGGLPTLRLEPFFISDLKQVYQGYDEWQVLEFGRVTIPPDIESILPEELGQILLLSIYVTSDRSVAPFGTLYGMDVCLMPVDEWACDVQDPQLDELLLGLYSGAGRTLVLDSITIPKRMIRAYMNEAISMGYIGNWRPSAVSPLPFVPGINQRFFFFGMKYTTAGNFWSSAHESLFRLEMFKNQRYESLRGLG